MELGVKLFRKRVECKASKPNRNVRNAVPEDPPVLYAFLAQRLVLFHDACIVSESGCWYVDQDTTCLQPILHLSVLLCQKPRQMSPDKLHETFSACPREAFHTDHQPC